MVILREEEVSPSSPSCCSSASSSYATRRCTYEVFLSFRGEDTRTNFTSHLYKALKLKGINTFRDDKRLERGKLISPELLKAIEESRFAVIVLSKNYANSKWCLDELAKIVECKKETGLIVLPVFYGVDPSEVRHQKGTFEEDFAKHEERSKEKNVQNVERWRSALREVANISGWDLGEWNESELIDEIVKRIFKALHVPFRGVMKGLVGIKHQVEELNRLLCIGSKDVRVIGISGMGGIGKTTLAKVICNVFFNDFESCIFIVVSNERNLIPMQQQLLCETLKEKNIHIWNVEHGVDMIKNRLHSKKILLVLDDVNHLDQFKYLAEERDWFGFGSRIIITTRDQQLLNQLRVDAIYKCKELNGDDALELFCLKAFQKKQPEEGYEEISQKFVEYASGLPLALDVLGSHLVGETIDYWKDILKRQKEYPENNIIAKLEISYNGLNNEAEKRIFLYIACFLKGRNQELIIAILESFGNLYPTSGINVLIKKSLITISHNIVWVHDLLQDLAWEILRKQSPTKLGNRIGLKLRKDILDVLTNNEGTKRIEIINQESSMEDVEEVANFTCNPKAFSKMRKLKFLRIQNVNFPQGIECLSNELQILEWHGYPLKSLPLGFQPKYICELNMRYSKIEKLWEGPMDFPYLRSIDLSCSENLIETLDLTRTPRLEALDLHGCTKLIETHPSILVHKKLNYLNMAGCISLENPPTKFEIGYHRRPLQRKLRDFIKRRPSFGENVIRLRKLYVNGIGIEETLGGCISVLSLEHSKRLQSLLKLPSNISPILVSVGDCASPERVLQFLKVPELGEQLQPLYEAWNFDNSVASVKRHLQEPYRRKDPFFRSIFAREIPMWFNHQCEGNHVIVELPPNWCDSMWLGFALCASFRTGFHERIVSVFVTMTLPDLQCIFHMKSLLTTRLDSQTVWYVPKDREAFELSKHIDWSKCSVKIAFNFEVDNWKGNIKMKCAVRLVHKQDVEELIQTNPERLATIQCNSKFSVKAAFWVNDEQKFTSEKERVWKLICEAKLPERQKFFLWKVCFGCLPVTKRLDSISKFHVAITYCPLCNDDMVDELHLFLKCAFSRRAWLGNSWGFRLGSIPFQSATEWVSFFLSPPSGFLPEGTDEEAFALFATVAMNSVWKMRQKCYEEGKVTLLEEVPSIVDDAIQSCNRWTHLAPQWQMLPAVYNLII